MLCSFYVNRRFNGFFTYIFRMVSFLELIPGRLKGLLLQIRIVKKYITLHQIFIAVEQELLLIQRQ